jgi:hypothetical protein
MYSWCSLIAGQVTCRSRVSASSGNHSRTRSCHSPSLLAGPPGTIPASTAGATYLRIVLRSTPSEPDISFSDLPACQCTSISVTSITSNVLLAIGPPSQTGGTLLLLDGQVHHDTHALPMGNYVIGVGNYVIATPSEVGNYKIADT